MVSDSGGTEGRWGEGVRLHRRGKKRDFGWHFGPPVEGQGWVRGKECCSPEKIVCSNIWWKLSMEHSQN